MREPKGLDLDIYQKRENHRVCILHLLPLPSTPTHHWPSRCCSRSPAQQSPCPRWPVTRVASSHAVLHACARVASVQGRLGPHGRAPAQGAAQALLTPARLPRWGGRVTVRHRARPQCSGAAGALCQRPPERGLLMGYALSPQVEEEKRRKKAEAARKKQELEVMPFGAGAFPGRHSPLGPSRHPICPRPPAVPAGRPTVPWQEKRRGGRTVTGRSPRLGGAVTAHSGHRPGSESPPSLPWASAPCRLPQRLRPRAGAGVDTHRVSSACARGGDRVSVPGSQAGQDEDPTQ